GHRPPGPAIVPIVTDGSDGATGSGLIAEQVPEPRLVLGFPGSAVEGGDAAAATSGVAVPSLGPRLEDEAPPAGAEHSVPADLIGPEILGVGDGTVRVEAGQEGALRRWNLGRNLLEQRFEPERDRSVDHVAIRPRVRLEEARDVPASIEVLYQRADR